MSLSVAMLIAGGIAMPHAIDLRTTAPTVAVALWMSALLLRAVAGCALVFSLVVLLPQTQLFNAITHWCWHTVLPLLATHMGLDGHRLGDAAAILPALVLAGSAGSVGWGIASATRSLRRLLRRHALGPGPGNSVIVGGRDVMLAAAGLLHPRIVVSAGALTALDDEELAAGLEHERGHIARQHRYLLLLGAMCRASSCFAPGGRHALTQLAFHLERDADRFALRRHDRFALASAICKAATLRHADPAFATLGGTGVVERLRQLLDGHNHRRGGGSTALSLLAILMVAASAASAVLVPAAGYAAANRVDRAQELRHCQR